MVRDFSFLEEAADEFFRLAETSFNIEDEIPFPSESASYFSAVNFALATLYQLGETRLAGFAGSEIIHYATLSGGSLNSAMSCAIKYMTGESRAFNIDEYEQLGRTCSSAKRVYEELIRAKVI